MASIPGETRLIPTGDCWCGCGADVSLGAFFAPGHDKRAEARIIGAEYGSVAAFVARHGSGPGGPKRRELERLAHDEGRRS
jgi:hypothetical protein